LFFDEELKKGGRGTGKPKGEYRTMDDPRQDKKKTFWEKFPLGGLKENRLGTVEQG